MLSAATPAHSTAPWQARQVGEPATGTPPDQVFHKVEHRRATAQALVDGGDIRLQLNEDGVNAYGCQARPDAHLLAFGSSTANVVSTRGFEAASSLFARLRAEPGGHAAQAECIRQRLAQLTGASGVPGSELVLAASGTDLHLIAQQLLSAGQASPLQAVMPDPSETGSSLPAALAGQHFSSQTCTGHAVLHGGSVGGTQAPQPITVALRESDGRPRPVAAVDLEFERQVQALMALGRRGLLVLTDQTKTGLIAPSPDCASRLLARYPQALAVLVDACQFRLSPCTVQAYLRRGFWVALTGSKFVTGPAFCGVLLLPAQAAQRARGAALLALQAYSQRSHWPSDWAAARALPSGPNVGLLLRWEAALAELTPFAQLPGGFVEQALTRWGRAVATRLAQDDSFEPLQAPALDRGLPHAGWDRLPTIFPFVLRRRAPSGALNCLSLQDTQRLHRALQAHTSVSEQGGGAPRQRCQFGQPVACGTRAGQAVTALRLCASARLLVAASQSAQGVDTMIDQALLALDQLKASIA